MESTWGLAQMIGLMVAGGVLSYFAGESWKVRVLRRRLEEQELLTGEWRQAAISLDRDVEKLRRAHQSCLTCSKEKEAAA